MFWRIGFLNAWRNIERSGLAILSILLAAGFITNTTSYNLGYAQGLFAPYRAIIGGEISAYGMNINFSAENGDTSFVFKELQATETTDLNVMMPELIKSGYIAPEQDSSSFSDADIQKLREMPSISNVYPRYQIPALSCSSYGVRQLPLRGRDLQLDALRAQSLENFISQGRWFSEADAEALVAIVCNNRNYPPGQSAPAIGDTLQILVPRIYHQDDETYYDYTNPLPVELKVIGVVQNLPSTREYSYFVGESEFRVGMQMVNNEVQIPLSTWKMIWQKAGGGDFVPRQLAITVNDISFVEDTVLEIRQAFPEFSFFSVPQLISRILPELTLEDPDPVNFDTSIADMARSWHTPEQSVLSLDLRLPLMVLILMNASLVVSANLLIMASERQKEIGILKTVGATRIQVIQMVLSEALLITTLGAMGGFLFFRFPAALNQWTNGVDALTMLASITSDLALLLFATCVSSLLFAMLPALRMANLAVRETLQGDSA